MNIQEFAKGRIRVPVPLRADAYTISSDDFAGEDAVYRSIYNFTNRYAPAEAWPELKCDRRMVLYGILDYIRNQLTDKVTHADVDESVEFMSTAHSFGGNLCFPEDMWRDIVEMFNGYLPIEIYALPEGSTFFPNEPVIQVKSIGTGFGEIAAHIEAIMVGMISHGTALATLNAYWYQQVRELVEKGVKPDSEEALEIMSRFFIHDFGMRACCTSECSELLGKANLLFFHGTDTFNAAYQAIKLGANRPTGTSILALAHRIVQGHNNEREAFEALRLSATKCGNMAIASYVLDCYNFKNAVENELYRLADKYPNEIFVGRPDSGEAVSNVITILNGLRKNVRFIEGNSNNPAMVDKIAGVVAENNLPLSGIVGNGGWRVRNVSRDILSSAYKLSAKGMSEIPVAKLSEDRGKMSVPGPNVILRPEDKTQPTVYFETNETKKESAYKCYYSAWNCLRRENNLPFTEDCIESFADIQARAISQFDSFADVRPLQVLSKDVVLFQNRLYAEHRGN